MKTTYFEGCKTLNEVKSLFKKLALKHHPDRMGGNEEIMKEINHQYELIAKNPFFKFDSANEECKKDYRDFPEIITKIIRFDIAIEVCGNWIWLSGNTYRYRKQLREFGFLYAHLKKMWYWRPYDYKSFNQSTKSMQYIRKKYGSDQVETTITVELTGG
jgi:curved DNA-binding protein CbpA